MGKHVAMNKSIVSRRNAKEIEEGWEWKRREERKGKPP